MIVNRFHHDMLGDADAERPAGRARRPAARRPGRAGGRRTSTTTTCWRGATAATCERLGAELGDRPLLLVPHLDDDVHDIDGLLRVRRFLFASEAERERMIGDVVA